MKLFKFIFPVFFALSFILPSISYSESIFEPKLDYLETSAPKYPEVARRNGWQGTVVLKALIEENGQCSKLRVEKSSGHKILDYSAMNAVKNWKFIPARLGPSTYASVALIPIHFTLKDTREISY